ncbi:MULTISPECIES: winged helix-turn-helix transcriptional regulator [Rothia]|uniref:HxlR family transcriptional regulator n=2 Tax=Rothia TaxID=32207 RepID=A0A1Y1RPR7_9MICC|nr:MULTISPECIES: helix-turn-helix domain-containing protein [Rothia]ORC18902.1 HxlR family transcriptional regulator [Rothia nasimurium]
MPSSTQVSADVRPASPPDAEQLPADVLSQHCPSRMVLRHLTDRWTPLIVAVLADGEPVRFKDIKTRVEGISPKVLTETLRSMERDGLVERLVTASVPPRVDYKLTPLGATTVEPLTAVRIWAETHLAEVQANRQRYDSTRL